MKSRRPLWESYEDGPPLRVDLHCSIHADVHDHRSDWPLQSSDKRPVPQPDRQLPYPSNLEFSHHTDLPSPSSSSHLPRRTNNKFFRFQLTYLVHFAKLDARLVCIIGPAWYAPSATVPPDPSFFLQFLVPLAGLSTRNQINGHLVQRCPQTWFSYSNYGAWNITC